MEKKEYYWSLIIDPSWTQAAIWTVENKAIKIIAIGPLVQWETPESLIEAANTTLSSAVTEFPDESEEEPTKTVFGVPPSWVEDGQISKDHLGKIKQICAKLSLSPSGFVVLPEAISHAVKIDEGAPLTGVVIGLGKSVLDVSLFKFGNLAGTVNIARSVSVADDVLEGLGKFAQIENLPSRFIIYDGKDIELKEAKDILTDTDWQEKQNDKIKFLHTPQFEIRDSNKTVEAVSLAGASEITEIEKIISPLRMATEDISESINEDQDQNVVVPHEELMAEDIGFVVNEEAKSYEAEIHEDKKVKLPSLNFKKMTHVFSIPLAKLKKVAKIKPRHKSSKPLPVQSLGGDEGRKKLYVIGAIVLTALSLFFLAWWFLPKAEVVVNVQPKTLKDILEVTLTTEASELNSENGTLPIEKVQIEVSGKKTTSTTGRKTVGDKAKGKVVVRNGTAVGIKLPAGTVLASGSNIKFITDEQASVSAALSPSSPGTISISVTAEQIGAEGNLAKDETFKVANYPKSEVDAIAESDITGGSSREITAVSQDDIKKLRESLTKELEEDAEVKLTQQISGDKSYVKGALSTSVIKEQSNHKVGDEANSIELELTLSAEGAAIQKSHINKLIEEKLKNQISQGFTLRNDQVKSSFKIISEGENDWVAELELSANLLPDINPNEVKKKIAGKYEKEAQEYLSTIPGYVDARLTINPKFPSKLGNIPRVLKNISIEIVAAN